MTARRVDPAMLRTVHVITEGESFKALYYDRESAALRPNLVVVEPDGSGGFEINDVGLKGDALDPRRKLAVVWGDSVVFGSGRGWAHLLDGLAPGWQFLNGGLEGDLYTNILRRAGAFNAKHPVALNLVMLGWHPFVPSRGRAKPGRSWFGIGKSAPRVVHRLRYGNEHVRHGLRAFLEATPNSVVITMPTALNPSILDTDLSAYFVDGGDEDGFRFIGNVPYVIEGQRLGYDHIVERNAIARELCGRLGVRVIDLFAALDTTHQPDFRANFLDMVHLRPRSYPLVAERIYDEIKDLLV